MDKKKEYKKWVAKLKPFWEEREKYLNYFRKIEVSIEKDMCRKMKKRLEFFYVDGECVGIGAECWDDRKKFQLIQDADLEKGGK